MVARRLWGSHGAAALAVVLGATLALTVLADAPPGTPHQLGLKAEDLAAHGLGDVRGLPQLDAPLVSDAVGLVVSTVDGQLHGFDAAGNPAWRYALGTPLINVSAGAKLIPALDGTLFLESEGRLEYVRATVRQVVDSSPLKVSQVPDVYLTGERQSRVQTIELPADAAGAASGPTWVGSVENATDADEARAVVARTGRAPGAGPRPVQRRLRFGITRWSIAAIGDETNVEEWSLSFNQVGGLALQPVPDAAEQLWRGRVGVEGRSVTLRPPGGAPSPVEGEDWRPASSAGCGAASGAAATLPCTTEEEQCSAGALGDESCDGPRLRTFTFETEVIAAFVLARPEAHAARFANASVTYGLRAIARAAPRPVRPARLEGEVLSVLDASEVSWLGHDGLPQLPAPSPEDAAEAGGSIVAGGGGALTAWGRGTSAPWYGPDFLHCDPQRHTFSLVRPPASSPGRRLQPLELQEELPFCLSVQSRLVAWTLLGLRRYLLAGLLIFALGMASAFAIIRRRYGISLRRGFVQPPSGFAASCSVADAEVVDADEAAAESSSDSSPQEAGAARPRGNSAPGAMVTTAPEADVDLGPEPPGAVDAAPPPGQGQPGSANSSAPQSPPSSIEPSPQLRPTPAFARSLSPAPLPQSALSAVSSVPGDTPLGESLRNGHFGATFADASLLGVGGFGAVYRAKHRLEAAAYAVKLVKIDGLDESQSVNSRRDFTEVSNLRRLGDTKHVVRYYTCWCEEPQFLPAGMSDDSDGPCRGSPKRSPQRAPEAPESDSGSTSQAQSDSSPRFRSRRGEPLPSFADNTSSDTYHASGLGTQGSDSICFEASTRGGGISAQGEFSWRMCDFAEKTHKSRGAAAQDREEARRARRASSSRDLEEKGPRFQTVLMIQMELCTGPTLRQWLDADNRPARPLNFVRGTKGDALELTFTKHLLKGIREIHAIDMVHRDIKPQNLFVQQGTVLKIGDLGLARMTQDRIKGESEKVGTPAYCAPEGGARAAAPADIFSAALVVLELLCPPFGTAMERASVLLAFRERGALPPHVEELREYASLLRRMSARQPEDRPTAEEAHAELKRLGSAGGYGPGSPILAQLASIPEAERTEAVACGGLERGSECS